MRPGWIIALLIIFLLLNIVNGICEMTFVTGEPETIFDAVVYDIEIIFSDANIFTKIWEGFTLPIDVIWLIFRAFWFDYAWLQGEWIYLRFLFMAVSVGVILAIWFAIRGTSSG